MRMIGLGDNVCDGYLPQGLYYPGGNCVNVAVNCKRDGFEEAAYMGVFGDDDKAEYLKWALDQEGISYERSRVLHAPTGQPGVNLNEEGDRIFVGGIAKDTAQQIVSMCLTKDDLAYLGGFDLCHSSCYSLLEHELHKLQGVVELSFDFSDYRDEEYLQKVCPYAKYGFFSGADLSEEEIKKLIGTCHELGTKIVGVTRGGKGALFSIEGKLYEQGIKKTEVVDTMGAGDSFIAGFLTKYTHTGDPVESLDFAATCAAKTCTIPGGFGYPHKL